MKILSYFYVIYLITVIQMENDHRSLEGLVKGRIAPLFYEGIQSVLVLMKQYAEQQGEDAQVDGCMARLVIQLSSLAVSPRDAIEYFIQDVSPLLHGVEYASIMQERLNVALNANNQVHASG